VSGYSNDPVILDQFARSAAIEFGLGDDVTLSLLNVSENATYLVTDPSDNRSIIRVHRPHYHSPEAIESELDWITALRTDNLVRTPEILSAPDGRRVVSATNDSGERRNAAMFEFMKGVEPTEDRLVDDFFTLGAIAARLHQHSRAWKRPAGFTRMVWDFDSALGPNGHWGSWRDGLAMGPQELEVLGRLAATIERRLAAFGSGPDRFGLVHADMRLANLLVDGSDVTVIDFDDCGIGWFMYDLGSSVSFIEDHPLVPAMTDSWVQGYRTTGELSKEEELELPTFVMLRRLLLVAWVGTHQDTDTGKEMGDTFTTVSCDLAENYLSKFS